VCVALLEEALELRNAGIKLPILVMGGFYGAAWGEVLRHRLTPVVHDAGQIESLADEVRYSSSEAVRVHLKVDTGMGRLGILPRDTAAVARMLSSRPEVELEGLMTHFACADSGDSESIAHQLDVFGEVTTALETLGHSPKVRHAANSAALAARRWSTRARLREAFPPAITLGTLPRPGCTAWPMGAVMS
jgi:alanine racemase